MGGVCVCVCVFVVGVVFPPVNNTIDPASAAKSISVYKVSEFRWEDTFRKRPPQLKIAKNRIYQNWLPENADVLPAINMTSWKNYAGSIFEGEVPKEKKKPFFCAKRTIYAIRKANCAHPFGRN